MNNLIKSGVIVLGALSFAVAVPAKADVSFSAASGDLAASAAFSLTSGGLQVVLTNTSASDVLVPRDVLTGMFFDIAGDPSLSPTSALLTSGSSVFYDPDGQPADGNVGGEWAYASGLSGAPDGATQGISSSGLGLFGAGNFNGPDLAGGPSTSVGGLQYGILSAGDNPATGNTGVTGSGGLIKNSVTFLLGSLPLGFDLASIDNVSFQYGTSLTEPNIRPPVPEPETYAMLIAGLGLLGFVAARRRRGITS